MCNLSIDEAIRRQEKDSLTKNGHDANRRGSRINDVHELRNSSSRERKTIDGKQLRHENEVLKGRNSRDIDGKSIASSDVSNRDRSTCTEQEIQRSQHSESNMTSKNVFLTKRNAAVDEFYDDSLKAMIAVVNDYHLSIDTNHIGTQIILNTMLNTVVGDH